MCIRDSAHARVNPAPLEHHPYTRGKVTPVGNRVEAEHPDLPTGGAPVPFEHFQGARLAGSVRAEERDYLPSVRDEVEGVHGHHVPVAHPERTDLDGRGET